MAMVPRESDEMRDGPELGLPPRWTRLRYVRCEACGAKALVAASQCPQCEEPLELRDSRGEPVPLAHCGNCDIYYPRKKGRCIWCGTAPQTFPKAAVAWGTVATVAFAGLVWGAWWAKNSELKPPAVATTAPDTGAVVVIPAYSEKNSGSAGGEAALPRDSARADFTSVASGGAGAATVATSDSLAEATAAAPTATDATPDSSPAPTPTPVVPRVAAAPPPTVAPPARVPPTKKTVKANTPARVAAAPTPKRVTPTPAPSRAPARWATGTVRGWLRVKASASSGSRTVAMIGPDTRLQVGETRGSWVRVRSAGASGWVEQQQFQKNVVVRRPPSVARGGTGR